MLFFYICCVSVCTHLGIHEDVTPSPQVKVESNDIAMDDIGLSQGQRRRGRRIGTEKVHQVRLEPQTRLIP